MIKQIVNFDCRKNKNEEDTLIIPCKEGVNVFYSEDIDDSDYVIASFVKDACCKQHESYCNFYLGISRINSYIAIKKLDEYKQDIINILNQFFDKNNNVIKAYLNKNNAISLLKNNKIAIYDYFDEKIPPKNFDFLTKEEDCIYKLFNFTYPILNSKLEYPIIILERLEEIINPLLLPEIIKTFKELIELKYNNYQIFLNSSIKNWENNLINIDLL